jgi:hypothetical protein
MSFALWSCSRWWGASVVLRRRKAGERRHSAPAVFSARQKNTRKQSVCESIALSVQSKWWVSPSTRRRRSDQSRIIRDALRVTVHNAIHLSRVSTGEAATAPIQGRSVGKGSIPIISPIWWYQPYRTIVIKSSPLLFSYQVPPYHISFSSTIPY